MILLPASAAAQYVWKDAVIRGGGFVTGITYHPAQQGLVYARTDVGGAYRSTDSGQNWAPITDWLGRADQDLMGVDALAVDPSDPSRVYLVGGKYTASSWARAAALLRSSDQGANFEPPINITLNGASVWMGGNSNGRQSGERLAVDPTNGDNLFLGTRMNGVLKSTDRGSTWTQVATWTTTTNCYLGNDCGVALVQFANGRIYVGMQQNTAGATTLYRSTDGYVGQAWEAVPNQPTGLVPHHVALDRDGVTLYLAYSDALGPGYNNVPSGATITGAVWKLNTNTGAWTNITPATAGFSGVSADAQASGTLVATTHGWWPDAVYRSTNGGSIWTRVSIDTRDTSSARWAAEGTPHWMEEIEIDPFDSSRALFVTGYGIFGTTSLTDANPTWVFQNNGLEETAVNSLFAPTFAELLSALADIGGFRHYRLTESPFWVFRPWTGNTSIDVAERYFNTVVRAHWGDKRGSYSTDGGARWTDMPSAPSEALAAYPGGPNGIAVSPHGKTWLWWPKASMPYYSTDRGTTWTQSSSGPKESAEGWQNIVPVSDRVNSSIFYLYDVKAGNLHVSKDGGVTFPTVTAVPADTSSVPILRAVPGYEGHLWFPGQGNGLYRSTDAGTSFTRLASVQEAYQVGLGQSSAGWRRGYPAIYLWGKVNNVTGIFRSDDTGTSWTRINDDKHQYGLINVVTGHPRVYGRVYLGTAGRGIVYGDPRDFSISVPSSLVLPLNGSRSLGFVIQRVGDFTDPVTVTVNGLPSGVTAAISQSPTTRSFVVVTLTASSTAVSGTYTVTITATGGGLTRSDTLELRVGCTAAGVGECPCGVGSYSFCDNGTLLSWTCVQHYMTFTPDPRVGPITVPTWVGPDSINTGGSCP